MFSIKLRITDPHLQIAIPLPSTALTTVRLEAGRADACRLTSVATEAAGPVEILTAAAKTVVSKLAIEGGGQYRLWIGKQGNRLAR